ncbi:MAG: ABC transporter permease [Lachnospiraceae bacterium]|nr:ABC transporter permease [Lachnospiraceae bacterium]
MPTLLREKELKKNLGIEKLMRSYGTVIACIIIILVFSILRPDAFFTIKNLINITRQISLLVVIALGATLVMSVDEFDLSVGAVASLGGIISAKLAVFGINPFLCIVLPVLLCTLIGYLNGMIVTRFRVLSFITTLAMSTVLAGFTFWLSGGATVFENIPESFKYLGSASILGIPLLTLIMVLLCLIFRFILNHTPFGRRLYAIGGNVNASLVSGINVARNKNLAFALCGALSALTGVMLASRLGSAHPTGGDGYFMNSYAAVFLGRTVVKEGIPNVWGTFVGAAILGILANGLTIMQVPSYLQDVLTGVIIILAVIAQKVTSGENM